jgi:glycosyltransferase involved in cell wall biosynthesis
MKTATMLVYSSLFPSPALPNAGLFVRERAFRAGRQRPIVVVAPQPWFPFQALGRLLRPGFRPSAPTFSIDEGIEIHRPRWLSFPGVLKSLDGLLMALSVYFCVRRIVGQRNVAGIDAHFAYPDGRAATLLGRWLRLPVMVTLRGKEERQLRSNVAPGVRRAIRDADRIVAVSAALAAIAVDCGADPTRVRVIGNGVDLDKFRRLERNAARCELGLPEGARILVSVGGLVERKGFHRVIACLPKLLDRFPDLVYLVVGGNSAEGDMGAALREQVATAGLESHVRFLGQITPDRLAMPLSAADVFVLATSYEGWANVFLEAMACGLPVVTTRVGGNAEVVTSDRLGMMVPFGDATALESAIAGALERWWDRDAIVTHAAGHGWNARIPQVLAEWDALLGSRPASPARRPAQPVTAPSHDHNAV